MALSIGKATANLVHLLVLAILSRLFVDKTDYAAYQQTIVTYMMVAPFLTLGLDQGIFYFLPAEKERVRGRVIDSMILVLISGILFSAFVLLGGNQLLADRSNNPAVAGLLLLLIPYVFANLALRLLPPILTVQDQVFQLSVFEVINRFLIGVATVVPVFVVLSPSSAVGGMAVGSLVVATCGLVLVYRSVPKDPWQPSMRSIKELAYFSFPLGLATSIAVMNVQLDKMIVSIMKTPEEFAEFVNGAVQIPLVGILTGSIATVLIVDLRNAASDGNYKEAVELFRKMANLTSYILFPVAIYLFIFADSFIVSVFSAEYENSVHPFRIYLLLIPVRTVSFGALMISLGQNRETLFRSVVAILINLILSIVLVRTMGSIGAAISTVFVTLVWVIPFSIYVICRKVGVRWHELLPFKHFADVFIRLLPYTLSLIVLAFVTRDMNDWIRLITTFAFGALWIGIWLNGRLYEFETVKRKVLRHLEQNDASSE